MPHQPNGDEAFFLNPKPYFFPEQETDSDESLKNYLCAMNWFILIIAGLFETGFAACLGKAKETQGATSMWWLGGFLTCLAISMVLLYKATQTLPIGTAYAVWTGIGAVGTAIVGMVFFKESTDFWRIFFIITLIGSIVGLKFVSE